MTKKKKTSFRGRIGRNIEKKKSERKGRSYLSLPDGVTLFKPEKGSVKFDILPYIVTDEKHLDRDDDHGDAVVGDIWWKKAFKVHKGVGVDGETVVCPKTFGKPCPICEHGKQLNDDGEEWDDIKEIYSKDRSLYVIIPIDASGFEEEYEEKPYVLDMSYHLFEKQLDEELGIDEAYEAFPNLEGGLTLDVRFREKKFGKAVYYETAVIKFEERDADYEDAFVDDIPNLDEMLTVLSYDQLKTMYFEQQDPDESPEFEEVNDTEISAEEKTKPPRKKKNTKAEEVVKEPAEKKEKPTRKKITRKQPDETSEDENKCPHGHVYGQDGNKKNECADCELWDACMDEQEKNE